MDPLIDLAPGAEQNPLAVRVGARIKESIAEDPGVLRSFLALKSTVLLVPFDTGDAITLRFDLGKLVIYDGNVGIPSVTLGGPNRSLERLDELGRTKKRDLFAAFLKQNDGGRRAVFGEAAKLLFSGEVKVYGAFAHPRTIVRLLRLLTSSAAAPPSSRLTSRPPP